MVVEQDGALAPCVAVAIPTFRRPVDIARLLAALPAVIDCALRSGSCRSVDVIVIDNDPDGSAESAVSSARVPARYVRERRRGLAAVRNRALDEARPADILVFIDDDETPAAESWLQRLLETQRQARATVVAGPVRTVVDGGLDPWIVAGGFYARTHRSALTSLDPITSAASNNLLLVLADVERAGVRFDDRFGTSGGEDSLFTTQLHAAGATMVWCAGALVLDHLLPERQTRAHALARSRGMEAASVRVALVQSDGVPARRARIRARAVLIASVWMVVGAFRRVGARITGSLGSDARGARSIARGLGAWDGAFGRRRALYGNDPALRETAAPMTRDREGTA